MSADENRLPIPLDENNDGKLNENEFAAALLADHGFFKGKDANQGVAHTMIMPNLDDGARQKVTLLSKLLGNPGLTENRETEIREELETILEGAASKGLEKLKTEITDLTKGLKTPGLSPDIVQEVQNSIGMMKEITSTFNKVDFDPAHIEDVAELIGGKVPLPEGTIDFSIRR